MINSPVGYLPLKNNLYFSGKTCNHTKQYNNVSNCDSVSFSHSKSVNENSAQISQNLSKVIYKHGHIGMKPIAFGSNPSHEMAKEVAGVLFKYRRTIDSSEPAEALDVFSSVWKDRLGNYVSENKPVEMMIAAFPFKSLSRNKCVSEHADMAEVSCVKYLKSVIDDIKEVYPPGAKLHIFSDGHMFSRIEGNPTDESAKLYSDELKNIIHENGASDIIELHTLEDIFGGDFKEGRESIIRTHGETTEQIRDRVKSDPILGNDYCGIKRFIYEELGGIDEYSQLTNTKRQKLSKDFAYKTVQASETWTKFLHSRLPNAIRLSCHPQNFDSPNKIGFYLGKTKDNWLTPWMGVAVKVGDNDYTLMQNIQAKQLGLNLIKNDKGLPSHYEIPKGMDVDTVLNTKKTGNG